MKINRIIILADKESLCEHKAWKQLRQCEKVWNNSMHQKHK